MITKVYMKKLGITVSTQTVVKWFKESGSYIKKEEPLVEISSENSSYIMNSPTDGILKVLLVNENEEVPACSTICIIASKEEDISNYLD